MRRFSTYLYGVGTLFYSFLFLVRSFYNSDTAKSTYFQLPYFMTDRAVLLEQGDDHGWNDHQRRRVVVAAKSHKSWRTSSLEDFVPLNELEQRRYCNELQWSLYVFSYSNENNSTSKPSHVNSTSTSFFAKIPVHQQRPDKMTLHRLLDLLVRYKLLLRVPWHSFLRSGQVSMALLQCP